MSRYRKGAGGKRDANEPDIIKVLRAHGCVVMQLSGKGIPDLLVLRKGKKWLADVKMPGKPTTEAQEELWEEAATKAQCAVFILRTPNDAVAMLNNALQPWEPAVLTKAERQAERLRGMGMRVTIVVDGEKTGSIRAPRPHGDDRRPRKGDAARARTDGKERLAHRETCRFNDCETGERCGKSATVVSGYTPPRSKPVAHRSDCEQSYHKDDREPCTCGALDAAKEAEAFAPADDGHKPCARDGCRKRVLGSDTCMEHDEPEFGSEAWARRR